MNKVFNTKKLLIFIGALIFTLVAIIAFSWSYASTKNLNRNYSDEQWIKDIDYVVDQLNSTHPNAYKYITKAEFNKEIEKLKKDVKKLSDDEIVLRLSSIIARVKDAHTTIELPQKDILPIGLQWFGEDLYLTHCDKKYESFIGGKLVSINGISLADCQKRLVDLISSENEYGLRKDTPRLLIDPSVLKYKKISTADKVKYTFIINGKHRDIEVTPIDFKIINSISILDTSSKKPLYLQNIQKKDYFWYDYNKNDRILYFQYNICYDSESINNPSVPNDIKSQYVNLPKLSETTDKLLQILIDEKPAKLIIDLRNNTGGIPASLDSFIKNLEDIISPSERKNIYFITGNKTFSAAVEISVKLKKFGATSVGEPTSNKINFYANRVLYKLPNSKYYFYCSSDEEIFDDKDAPAFTPEFIVNQTFSDYLNGEDTIYNFIKSKAGSISYIN